MMNKFLVSASADGREIQIMNPKYRLTPDEALELAAWLVAVSQSFATRQFHEILNEVES
jgi:hypothetical protein